MGIKGIFVKVAIAFIYLTFYIINSLSSYKGFGERELWRLRKLRKMRERNHSLMTNDK
jgi:hypothetical protein